MRRNNAFIILCFLWCCQSHHTDQEISLNAKQISQADSQNHFNLSTKDISRLANIDINSIEMTRYHIRKKLNMEQGENLAAFMMTV